MKSGIGVLGWDMRRVRQARRRLGRRWRGDRFGAEHKTRHRNGPHGAAFQQDFSWLLGSRTESRH